MQIHSTLRFALVLFKFTSNHIGHYFIYYIYTHIYIQFISAISIYKMQKPMNAIPSLQRKFEYFIEGTFLLMYRKIVFVLWTALTDRGVFFFVFLSVHTSNIHAECIYQYYWNAHLSPHTLFVRPTKGFIEISLLLCL